MRRSEYTDYFNEEQRHDLFSMLSDALATDTIYAPVTDTRSLLVSPTASDEVLRKTELYRLARAVCGYLSMCSQMHLEEPDVWEERALFLDDLSAEDALCEAQSTRPRVSGLAQFIAETFLEPDGAELLLTSTGLNPCWLVYIMQRTLHEAIADKDGDEEQVSLLLPFAYQYVDKALASTREHFDSRAPSGFGNSAMSLEDIQGLPNVELVLRFWLMAGVFLTNSLTGELVKNNVFTPIPDFNVEGLDLTKLQIELGD